MSMKFEF